MAFIGRGIFTSGILAIGLALSSGAAQANLVISYASSSPSGGGSNWVYNVTLDQTQAINTSLGVNFATLYDFSPNLTLADITLGGSIASWIPSIAFITPPPAGITLGGSFPPDAAGLVNITITANAGFPFTDGAPLGLSLGTITLHTDALDKTHGFRKVSHTGQAQDDDTGDLSANVGSTIAPVPGPVVGAGLPGLVAACFGLLAFARRRRQKYA